MPNEEHVEVRRPATSNNGLLRVLRTLAVVYLLLCLLMMFLERYLVYHPPAARDEAEEIAALGGEEVWFTAEDGTELHGWYFAHPKPQQAILYAHGNGEDAGRNAEYMAMLRDQLQSSIFIFDYRGYGFSEGKPDEPGLILDGLAAQKWLAEQEAIRPEDVVLMGRSLGGGVMVALAEQLGAKALVIHSSFANMVDIGASRYPWLPVRWLMQNRYPSEQRIKNYVGPLLQLHGTDDRIVPLHLARPLFEAAPAQEKRFVEISGGTHNDPLTEDALQQLAEFLNSLP